MKEKFILGCVKELHNYSLDSPANCTTDLHHTNYFQEPCLVKYFCIIYHNLFAGKLYILARGLCISPAKVDRSV